MKFSINKLLYFLFISGLLLFIYKMTTQPTNKIDKYFQGYFEAMTPFPVVVDPAFDLSTNERIGSTMYKRGFSILGYKALMGHIEYRCIRDTVSQRYFRIYVIDDKSGKMVVLRQAIEGKRIYLYANSDDLANPEYGTKERPIPVFSYKGMDKPLLIPVGNDGYENLEPTQAEFEHNVRCYLTYVMSKEEFNARFKNSKK